MHAGRLTGKQRGKRADRLESSHLSRHGGKHVSMQADKQDTGNRHTDRLADRQTVRQVRRIIYAAGRHSGMTDR